MRALILSLLVLIGCAAPAYPVVPTNAAPSTFKVNVTIMAITEEGPAFARGSATAWVVANVDGHSRLVTAKHACPSEAEMALNGAITYELVGQNDATIDAKVLRRSDKYDLCLLEANTVVGPPIPVSPRDPVYDQPVSYVGAPLGYYGEGLAPTYSGFYVGHDTVALPTAPGASGSAVFTRDGVIGVLVRVSADFPDLMFLESRAHLVEFLAQ